MLPGNRSWRSTQPYALLLSIVRGLTGYTYRGIVTMKHPMDFALYTRLIWELKPKTIFEIGSFHGGSAIWMRDLLKTFDIDGRIISVDVNPPSPPFMSSNITFLRGDANSLGATLTSTLLSEAPRPWLVIEDSNHKDETALAVAQFFDPHLRSGEYLILEDAISTQMGQDYAQGPKDAITRFLQERGNAYEIDARYCDFYGQNVTGNPNGYLRRK